MPTRRPRPSPVSAALLVIAALSLVGHARAPADEVAFPERPRPSYQQGRQLYQQACTGCHAEAPLPSFFSRSWRRTHAPRELVELSLGRRSDHPEALTDPLEAWHIAAFVWSQGVDAETYRTGEALVAEAQQRLGKRDLARLLLAAKQLKHLLDPNWVMSQDSAAIIEEIRSLVGAEFDTLSDAEREALVTYIYLSSFDLDGLWQERQYAWR